MIDDCFAHNYRAFNLLGTIPQPLKYVFKTERCFDFRIARAVRLQPSTRKNRMPFGTCGSRAYARCNAASTVADDDIAIGSVADRCLLSGVKQKSHFKGVRTVFDPELTSPTVLLRFRRQRFSYGLRKIYEPFPTCALAVATVRSKADLLQKTPRCVILRTALGDDLAIGIRSPNSINDG
jgi:hypothetical protein